MNEGPRIQVLACGVLAADLRALAPKIPARLTFEFLPGQLHATPHELRRRLQERIDAVSAAGTADVIAIGYGVCGRGTVGLHARGVPLRVPKTHDCIALFLGSDAAYREQFARCPGTYYVSAGWVQEGMGSASSVASPAERGAGVPGGGGVCPLDDADGLGEHYGSENVQAIRTFMDSWKRNYSRAAFIDTGIGNTHHARIAQAMAQENGWDYEALSGSHAVLAAVLTPTPDPRVCDVPPGMVTAFDAVSRSLIARQPSGAAGARAQPASPPSSAGTTRMRRTGYGLGIDAGGTYTDAAVFDWTERRVVAKAKAPTTHWDYAIGIGGALDLLPPEVLRQVREVAVSTTLATNAIVEGRGQRVGLLLMPPAGDDGLERISHRPVRVVPGRLAIDGTELAPTDLGAAARAARELVATDGVRAFAVTGYASSINPAHELAVMRAVKEATGLPVTCGHEVSALLDYRVRAETAALNARIIPCLEAFLERLQESLCVRGITAPAMIVRSDGSLMNVRTAAERPVETLLSGPAASIAGARFLCDARDALVIDIGGTTSDTAVLHNGAVRIDPDGARVGHWRTHVRALAVRTIGIGGDSEVRQDAHGWHVGPQRVWPVCRLDEAAGADAAAACLDWVQTHAGEEAGSQVICARMPGGANLDGLDERQQAILRLLDAGPMTISRLVHETRCLRQGFLGIELLVDRQRVRFFGFTPTDALHVQGQLAMWNTGYARRYAEAIGAAEQLDAEAVSRRVLDQVEVRLAHELLMTRLADCSGGQRGLDHDHGVLARALLDRGLGRVCDGLGVAFDLGVPMIGIGAPAAFLLPAAAGRLRAEVIIPRDGDVANAVGAITSQVRVERQVVIVPDELGRLHVHGLPGAPTFIAMAEAQAFAEQELTRWVLRLARESGARDPEATLCSDDRIIEAAGGMTVFLSRTLSAVAAGGI
ncbi:MAG: DUF1638 domain-containing protein [Lentisphaerae bacterium]|nr:DUF1638 domain-containing protein [Lentisphaerota bacterium]